MHRNIDASYSMHLYSRCIDYANALLWIRMHLYIDATHVDTSTFHSRCIAISMHHSLCIYIVDDSTMPLHHICWCTAHIDASTFITHVDASTFYGRCIAISMYHSPCIYFYSECISIAMYHSQCIGLTSLIGSFFR